MRLATGLTSVVALVVLGLPASAAAQQGPGPKHGEVRPRMILRGSHGYRITIDATSHGTVALTAGRGGGAATYLIPGRVTSHGIRANLGRLGRIAVRFRRIGKPRVLKPLPRAHGRKCPGPIGERGRFEGTIRFRGEQGYTKVAVRGADGSVIRTSPDSCRNGAGAHRDQARAQADDDSSVLTTALLATSRRRGLEVRFGVVSAEIEELGERELLFNLAVVSTSERRGRISIVRYGVTQGNAGSIKASPLGVQPVTATVGLPKPFSGTASYLEEAGAPPSWTGSLKARLPGAEVPLTGPDIRAVLCRQQSRKKLNECLEAVDTQADAPGGLFRLLQRLGGPGASISPGPHRSSASD
jgi:hypothetical protein